MHPGRLDLLLSSADFDGINFIAIQALEKRTNINEKRIVKSEEQTDAKIDKLKNELIALQQENSELKQKLLTMESGFKNLEVLFTKYQNQKNETDSKIILTNLK